MAETPQESAQLRTTSARWNAVRLQIASGDAADTPLEALSQQAGLDGWPIKSPDETPSKYIELSFDELRAVPEFTRNPKLIDRLCFVLMSAEESPVAETPPPAPAAPPPAPPKAKPQGVPGVKTSPEDWDRIRKTFAKSMMSDIKLRSLAENIELPPWPLKGEDETPAKYMEFTLFELAEMNEFLGKPGRIDLLFNILNQNLSHDEAFEDMVIPINQHLDRTDSLLQVLRRLDIDENYPFALLSLPKRVRETVPVDQIKTLGDFVRFYQKISEKGVVLGEIKVVLQAISAGDEPRLAAWLPFRPGAPGLHLPEAIALVVRTLDQDSLKSLVKKYGKKLDPADDFAIKATWSSLSAKAESLLDTALLDAAPHFAQEMAQIRSIIDGSGETDLDRHLLPLGDSDLELIVAHTLLRHRRGARIPAAAAVENAEPSPGFLSRVRALFSRR